MLSILAFAGQVKRFHCFLFRARQIAFIDVVRYGFGCLIPLVASSAVTARVAGLAMTAFSLRLTVAVLGLGGIGITVCIVVVWLMGAFAVGGGLLMMRGLPVGGGLLMMRGLPVGGGLLMVRGLAVGGGLVVVRGLAVGSGLLMMLGLAV